LAQRRLTQGAARRIAIGLPNVVEKAHFGRPDFRVGNRIFATLLPDPHVLVLKSTPVNTDTLVAADRAAFWNEWRGRWVGVRLDRISAPMLRALIIDAWRIVAPKRLAAKTKF
jgi:hypothetical protein